MSEHQMAADVAKQQQVKDMLLKHSLTFDSAGTIPGAVNAWFRLCAWGDERGIGKDRRFDNCDIRTFLEEVGAASIKAAAVRNRKLPKEAVVRRRRDGMQAASDLKCRLRFCEAHFGLECPTNDVTVLSVIPAVPKSAAVPARSLSTRMVADIERLANNAMEHKVEVPVQVFCAGITLMTAAALRFAHVQRASLGESITVSGLVFRRGFVTKGKDPKKSRQGPRAFLLPEQGLCHGSAEWLRCLEKSIEGMESQRFIICDNNSDNGDPFKATELEKRHMDSNRFRVAMRQTLKFLTGMTTAALYEYGVKSMRAYLPGVYQARGFGTTLLNEGGGWSSSVLASLYPVDPLGAVRRAPVRRSVVDRYVSEPGETFVCRLLASHIGVIHTALRTTPRLEWPFQGGWDKFPIASQAEQSLLENASIDLLEAEREMALLAVEEGEEEAEGDAMPGLISSDDEED